MRVRGSLSPPHSHAWLLDMFPMHYARRRCAIYVYANYLSFNAS